MATKPIDTTAGLRYLAATSVRCPAGTLARFRVCTSDAAPLGSISGVLIRPSERRIEYFVVESPGLFLHRQYLVPADAGAFVQEPNVLQLSAKKDELDLQTFKLHSVQGFSESELGATTFSEDAA